MIWIVVVALAAPLGAAGTFNVTNYGAVGDGSTNSTAGIQAAINAAKAAGGGLVLLPSAAGNYMSDSLTLASNINFQVAAGATLQMEPMGTYQGGSASPPIFLYGSGLTNVGISGGGTIDGQGAAWWNAFIANSATVRPASMIYFSNCTGVTVTGITIQNAPKINQQFFGDTNVLIDGITVFNPYASASNNISPNTDGMDVASVNVMIRNCNISTGDDVIAIGSSSKLAQNITVTGCTFGTGHGLSIGSHTIPGVNGLWVDHCTFTGTQYGVRFKSDRGSGGLAQNLHYSDLTMTGIVYYPIFLDSYYGVSPAPTGPTDDPGGPASLGAGTPQWKDITFTNINASTASGAKGPLHVWGLPEALATRLLFDNVSLAAAGKNATVYHAAGVSFTCTCRINGAAPSASNVTTSDANVAYLACPLASPTPSRTPAGGATATPSATAAAASPSPTATRSASPSPTQCRSATATPSASPPASATSTWTRTASETATSTASSSASPTRSATATPSRSPSPAASASPTPTLTGTPSAVSTPSATWTATALASPTATASRTALASATATGTQSPTAAASATVTESPAASRTASPAMTPNATAVASGTPTAGPSATDSPTALSTPVPTATASPVAPGPSDTATASPALPTVTWTATEPASATVSPAGSATAVASFSATPSPSPAASATATPTPALTASATPTGGASGPTPDPTPDGGALLILAAQAQPNPDPTQVRVELNSGADRVELAVWSVALRRLDRVVQGPLHPGWTSLPLPAGFLKQAAPGAYYFSVQAFRGAAKSPPRLGRFFVLR